MALKGTKFNNYTVEFKLEAVKLYEGGNGGYKVISEQLGLRSHTQLRNWVQKYRNGDLFIDGRGKSRKASTPFIGRPKTKFISIEEENSYLKAQVEYLKKRYPNILGEG